MSTPLRIGTLGAASITPNALIGPAHQVEGVTVAAVAARDRNRAERFAGRHGIPVVHDSYAALIEDPNLDAVYVPLPNALHAEWTVRAVEAGKHVLCEKPFAANAEEAQRVADVAAGSDRVVAEAFHYRYHPLIARARELLAADTIGAIERVDARLCFPVGKRSDIRFRYDLAGGATMDAGCYPLHVLRTLGPGEPTVVAAHAKLRDPQVDRAMRVALAYPDGATGTMLCSIWSSDVFGISCRVTGTAGSLHLTNYLAPQYWHRLTVRTPQRRWHEKVPGEATYTLQLRAFLDACRGGAPMLTPAADAVATMRLIDDVYRAAGLEPRS